MSLREAAILIFSPLAGLRPSRSGVSLTLNFPNPGSEISSRSRAHDAVEHAVHNCLSLRLAHAIASAIFATRSDVFIQASSRTESAGVSHSLEVMSLRGAMPIRSGGSEFADLHD